MTSERWRALGPVLVAALVVEVVVAGALLLTRPPTGPASSAHATGPRGFAAWATLLERDGHPVELRRVPFDVEPPDPASTVVAFDADPSRDEVDALLAFVAAGGRLVAGGDPADDWVQRVLGAPLDRGGIVAACQTLAAVPETAGVQVVESSGERGFERFGAALPVLGCESQALAVVADVGAGRLVLVSDAAPFQEYLLGARDNATFARMVVGEPGRPVVFAEHLHGFEAPSGLAALPGRWRWAIALLVAAGAVALVARRAARTPSPSATRPAEGGSTVELEVVAAALARLPVADRGAAVQAAAAGAVRRRAALPATAGSEAIARAAVGLGHAPADADALRRPPTTDADLVAAARVLTGTGPTDHARSRP